MSRKQLFMTEDSEWTQVLATKVDDIQCLIFSNPCEAPEHMGLYHIFTQIIDYRKPSVPVIINTMPVEMDEYAIDGHYNLADIPSVAALFLSNFTKSRLFLGSEDAFVRGLYFAPIAMAYEEVLDPFASGSHTPTATQQQHPQIGGGSQDEEGPDMLGGFNLNELLE